MYRISGIEYLKEDNEGTLIKFVNGSIIRKERIKHILETIVNKGGSNLTGSLYCSRKLLGVTQMTPIKVSILPNIFLFPTHSINSRECYWLNYYQIRSIRALEGGSLITFFSNHQIKIAIGIRSIQRGMKLCAQYQKIYLDSNSF